MKKKDIYINGIGCVSPQHTSDDAQFLTDIVNSDRGHLSVQAPNYKTVLKGINLRRMSHLIKMGVYAGMKCIEDVPELSLDAIITGTGLGASEDTEIFLDDIYTGNEGVMSPTRFIQSTHNTVSSQIALLLKCYSYNFTYVHRGASFESALLDGLMMVGEDRGQNIMIGGIDEITDTYLHITARMKCWKNESYNQLDLLDQKTRGTIAGEGAAFFLLSTEKMEKSLAKLMGVKVLFKPKSPELIESSVLFMLSEHDLSIDDIDVVMLGMNGDIELDKIYYALNDSIFKGSDKAYFKHLCGEYKTASSFGMWAGCQMIDKNHVPDEMKLGAYNSPDIKNVLIYNSYNNSNHSLILLQHV